MNTILSELKDEETYFKKMNERAGLFFSEQELNKIRKSIFVIAGFGGVGAITAELLARMGVKKFRLLDKDKYGPSNLNRQLFATSKTLGRFKAEVAAGRIKEINPYAEIEMLISERVTNENVARFVKGADIVIQVTDSPSSYLFYHTARKHKIPLVNGYCTATGTKVQVFDFRNSQCRCLIETIKDAIKWRNKKRPEQMSVEELIEFDKQFHHGVVASISFVTNTTGCFVVAEAIKLITGRGKVCHYPKQINFDLFSLKLNVRNAYSLWNLKNYSNFFKLIKKLTGKKKDE